MKQWLNLGRAIYENLASEGYIEPPAHIWAFYTSNFDEGNHTIQVFENLNPVNFIIILS